MTAARRVLPGLAAGGLLVAGVVVTGYAALHAPSRDLRLGPTREVAAPVPRPERVSSSAGPAVRVSPTWVATYAARTGIPARALQAYADAALRAPCQVGWTTLAGIGWVESEHGTIGGRRLGSDGRPSRPIRGPALDGADGLAAVRGRGGAWARAEGPMQFLPRTWTTWSTDGDGDGTADPQDLDDAALAAARYLCAAGADLGSGPGWVSAIRSYNHSDDYVRSVYAAASAYGGRAR